MYRNTVEHPEDPAPYNFPFNDISAGASMAPLTFKDTKLRDECSETLAKDGGYVNYGEIDEVDITLKKIYSEKGNIDLSCQIFVTSQYRAHDSEMEKNLTRIGRILHSKSFREREKVLVSTVDSLQGKERRIVILTLTRSNNTSHIGFLRDPRRLNVATSRARHMLVIVGYGSTVYRSSMTGASDPSKPGFDWSFTVTPFGRRLRRRKVGKVGRQGKGNGR